jgi:hypothetical protein
MSSDPIDLPSALERVDNDKEFLESLLDLYQEDFVEKYGRLKNAAAVQDFAAVQEIGHSLKGASANLSLLPLQELFLRLERAGLEGDGRSVEETLPQVEREFNRLKEYRAARHRP